MSIMKYISSSPSPVLSVTYKYWGLRMDISLEMSSSSEIEGTKVLEDYLVDAAVRIDQDNKVEVRREALLFYLILWLCKKLPGAVKFSKTSIRKGRGPYLYRLEIPPLLFLKTVGLEMGEPVIEGFERELCLMKDDKIIRESRLSVKSMSIKTFKNSTVENFMGANPHCVCSPVMTVSNFWSVETVIRDKDVLNTISSVFSKKKENNLTLFRSVK
uniref:Matrix protein n=1 Tax=Citrus-associated rhabdovirus TaxID=2754374 RepID=A0A7D7LFT7_9RHAB|nr:matrix protein [Citrus-associated rhabdovirus]